MGVLKLAIPVSYSKCTPRPPPQEHRTALGAGNVEGWGLKLGVFS